MACGSLSKLARMNTDVATRRHNNNSNNNDELVLMKISLPKATMKAMQGDMPQNLQQSISRTCSRKLFARLRVLYGSRLLRYKLARRIGPSQHCYHHQHNSIHAKRRIQVEM